MNLNQLYYFRTLARVLNFRRASEQLYIAQPTLSIAIAHLEEELGVELFVREGRHVELTKCGKEYFDRLDPILGELDRLNGHMKRMSSASEGQVDIGYIAPLTRNFIPENVRVFLSEPMHEKITFQFREDTTMALLDGLTELAYDIVFCPYVKDRPEITFVPILQQAIVAIVPCSHRLAGEEEIAARDLAGEPFVAYMSRSGLRSRIDALCESGGLVPNIICDASNEDGIAALVANGFGVSIVAYVASLAQSHVSVLKLKEPDASRTICMAYLRAAQQPPAVQEFLQFIRERRLATSDTRLADASKPME